MSSCRRGDWVEISAVILSPGERAPGLPKDTAAVPYTMRVRGFALAAARVGRPVRIRTQAGREIEGRLEAVGPAFRHGFGGCVPQLFELRRRLTEAGRGLAGGGGRDARQP